MGIITNNISVDRLIPHPDNPRKDVGDVSELAKSIKENGVMQNLTVIPIDEEFSQFMVLIGHRRLAAAKLAGIAELPCKIIHKDIPSRAKQIEIMLEENMQRNDLTPIEEAESFQLCLDLGETVEDLQNKTGFSEKTIRRRLNIAKLDKDVIKRKMEDDGFQLSLTDLYLLDKLPDVASRNEVLESASDRNQLKLKVNAKLQAIARDEGFNRLLPEIEAMGIKKPPKNFNPWDGKWSRVKEVDYEAEHMPNIKGSEGMIWYRNYRCIEIYEKKASKTPQTKKDLEEKKRKEEQKAFEAECKDMMARIEDAVEMLVQGKIKIDPELPQSYQKLIEEIVSTCAMNHAYANEYVYGGYFLCDRKNQYEYGAEHEALRQEAIKKAKKLPAEIKLISSLGYEWRVEPGAGTKTFADHQRKFRKETADQFLAYANVMWYAGYDLTDQEMLILTGQHPYYLKEEK